MKGLIFAAAVVAGIMGMQAAAVAQQQKAPVYRYCLLEAGGRNYPGGATLCRFNTLSQCLQSRNSFADTCIINPELTFPRR